MEPFATFTIFTISQISFIVDLQVLAQNSVTNFQNLIKSRHYIGPTQCFVFLYIRRVDSRRMPTELDLHNLAVPLQSLRLGLQRHTLCAKY